MYVAKSKLSNSMNLIGKNNSFKLIMLCLVMSALVTNMNASHLERQLKKRNFVELGCLGSFDASRFARLDRLCEECYSVIRTPGLDADCRKNCFRNNVFVKCIDVLLYTDEKQELNNIANSLYGQ